MIEAVSTGVTDTVSNSAVRTLLGRHRNSLLVAAAVVTGLTVPELGSSLEVLITPLVVFLVFSSVIGLQVSEIDVASYVLLIAVSLAISYVVLPVGGMWVASSILTDGGAVGFAIALSVPTTTGSAIVWTRLSRGDVQLATATAIVSLLVAPFFTPVVLSQLAGARAAVSLGSLLVELLVIVGGGVLLAVVVPSRLVTRRVLDDGATVAILLLIYTSVAGVDVGEITVGDLLGVLVVSLVLLVAGVAISLLCKRGLRLRRAHALPLFFTSSLKNLGIALVIAYAYADPLVTFTIITYYVIQQLFGAALADAIGD